jgi:DICT domain-containing protein
MSDSNEIIEAMVAKEEYLANAERIRTLEARQLYLLSVIKKTFDKEYEKTEREPIT